jgi:hypothetical protein
MTSSEDIRPEHAAMVQRSVARHLAYALRLRDRLQRLGLPPDDPLYLAATEAYYGLHHLHVRLHYLSCTHGVARPYRREDDASV